MDCGSDLSDIRISSDGLGIIVDVWLYDCVALWLPDYMVKRYHYRSITL